MIACNYALGFRFGLGRDAREVAANYSWLLIVVYVQSRVVDLAVYLG